MPRDSSKITVLCGRTIDEDLDSHINLTLRLTHHQVDGHVEEEMHLHASKEEGAKARIER